MKIKAADFIIQNKDILGAPISADDYPELTDGSRIFAITVAGGAAPKEERAIISAGYRMVVNASLNGNDDDAIITIGVAQNQCKVYYYEKKDLLPGGRQMLFHVPAMGQGDKRNFKPWKEWPINV